MADEQIWRTGDLVLVFQERIRPLAIEIERYYGPVKEELEQAFGWSFKTQPTVILMSSQDDFRKIVPNPLFVAVALPSRNTIIIDTSRSQSAPHTLRIILTHELAHLLLHQHIDRHRLPRWFDEGVCQWFTGGVAEVLLDPYRPMLGKALGSGEHIPLAQLNQRFPSDQRKLMLAYEQSRDIVTLIANRFGAESLIGVLNRLKAGNTIDESLRAQLGIDLEELEALWLSKLTGGVVWWGRLANHSTAILFAFAAVMTVAAFVLRRIRRRKTFGDEEDDDEY